MLPTMQFKRATPLITGSMMASERMQIDRFLDEDEEALAQFDWETVLFSPDPWPTGQRIYR